MTDIPEIHISFNEETGMFDVYVAGTVKAECKTKAEAERWAGKLIAILQERI